MRVDKRIVCAPWNGGIFATPHPSRGLFATSCSHGVDQGQHRLLRKRSLAHTKSAWRALDVSNCALRKQRTKGHAAFTTMALTAMITVMSTSMTIMRKKRDGHHIINIHRRA